jgi:hypothetical protein
MLQNIATFFRLIFSQMFPYFSQMLVLSTIFLQYQCCIFLKCWTTFLEALSIGTPSSSAAGPGDVRRARYGHLVEHL